MYSQNLLCFSLYQLPLVLPLGTIEKGQVPLTLHLPFRYSHMLRAHLILLFSRLSSPSSPGLAWVKEKDRHPWPEVNTLSNRALSPCRQYPLPSPLLGQKFHSKNVSVWSNMIFTWWNHAGYSIWSCSSVWKWFPGLATPPPSQGSRWGWLACSSLDPPCPSSR